MDVIVGHWEIIAEDTIMVKKLGGVLLGQAIQLE
jgi:hypothetical protein